METQQRVIDVETPTGKMAVIVSEPVDGEHPTVLWFIDAPGIRQAVRDHADRLAQQGYRVVVPDLHHRAGYCLPGDEALATNPNVTKEIWALIGRMTDEEIQADGRAALEAVGFGEEERCVTIGFCLGTRAVFRAVMDEPNRFLAGSCWHPSFMVDDSDESPHLQVSGLTRPLYFGVGLDDDVQSVEMHQPFFDAVADMDLVDVDFFAGAGHGFTWPTSPNYHEAAAEGSWSKTIDLFSAAFAR